MAYKIIQLGQSFNEKDIRNLEQQLSASEADGWEFVSVIPVTRRTCLFNEQSVYLMVLRQTKS